MKEGEYRAGQNEAGGEQGMRGGEANTEQGRTRGGNVNKEQGRDPRLMTMMMTSMYNNEYNGTQDVHR
ncbi:hypothetical protein CVT25_004732 [Psilocybe cyanescens]|uniref:Uncharacterized protein n=1 Tax=Psilocybe cyanescens TaxID=93625 RepID=A0A409WE20_PSICY|nr:hypothetical protein CVT25_004732 [Psilocybe cyanescens]